MTVSVFCKLLGELELQLASFVEQVKESGDTAAKGLKIAEERLVDLEDDKSRIELEAVQVTCSAPRRLFVPSPTAINFVLDTHQVKEMFKKEMLRWEEEKQRNQMIIQEYKAVSFCFC